MADEAPDLPPDPYALLRILREKQEERAIAYSDFNKAFSQYSESKNRVDYEATCQSVMKRFQTVNSTMVRLQRALRDEHNKHEWASMVALLQRREHEKLQITIKMHLHQADWLVARNDEYNQADLREHRLQRKDMAQVIEAINEILESLRYLELERPQAVQQ